VGKIQITKIWITVKILPILTQSSLHSRYDSTTLFDLNRHKKRRLPATMNPSKKDPPQVDFIRYTCQYCVPLTFRIPCPVYEELGFRLFDVGFSICIILTCLAYSFLSRRSLLMINGMTTSSMAMLTRILAINKYSHSFES